MPSSVSMDPRMARQRAMSQTPSRISYSPSISRQGCGSLPLHRQHSRRTPLRCVTENTTNFLRSPGSLESMLKTTTETGDIGLFSITPTIPPVSEPDYQQPGHARWVSADADLLQASRAQYRFKSNYDDRDRLPSAYRDTTSRTLSLCGRNFPRSETVSPENQVGHRTYSMPTRSAQYTPSPGPPMPFQTYGFGTNRHRSRSPFVYPARLRRPVAWHYPPSETDAASVGDSQHSDSGRGYQQQDCDSERPTHPHSRRQGPPLSLRLDSYNATASPAVHSSPGPLYRTASCPLRCRTPTSGQGRSRGAKSRDRNASNNANTRTCSLTSIVEMYDQHLVAEPTEPGKHHVEPFYYRYGEGFENAHAELDSPSSPNTERMGSLWPLMIPGTEDQDNNLGVSNNTSGMRDVEHANASTHVPRSGEISPQSMSTKGIQGLPLWSEEAAANVDLDIFSTHVPEESTTSMSCTVDKGEGSPLLEGRHTVESDDEEETAQQKIEPAEIETPLDQHTTSGWPQYRFEELRCSLDLDFSAFEIYSNGENHRNESSIVAYGDRPNNGQSALEKMCHDAAGDAEDQTNAVYQRHRRRNAVTRISTSRIEKDVVSALSKPEASPRDSQPYSVLPASALQPKISNQELVKTFPPLPVEVQQSEKEDLKAPAQAPKGGPLLSGETRSKLRLRNKAIDSMSSASIVDEPEALKRSSEAKDDPQSPKKFRVKVSQHHERGWNSFNRDGTVVRSPSLKRCNSLAELEYCAKKDIFTSHCRLEQAFGDGENGLTRSNPGVLHKKMVESSTTQASGPDLDAEKEKSPSTVGVAPTKQRQQALSSCPKLKSRGHRGLRNRLSFWRLRSGGAPVGSSSPMHIEDTTVPVFASPDAIHRPPLRISRQKSRWIKRWATKAFRLCTRKRLSDGLGEEA
ncbi:uncharacterized protein F5Z01DRAFT_633857 [Emericellopsis atlantica]|uniref:Uncharacterized protein n=1 Tax=Emericellopsis atlantica TaxID=2614577 RepID=A0A9P8CSD3_9HYPO|nr:uncharacterized protein F5Z01DRAFT_633857 [Emericellopsis atlantica]KAG9257085.1 hypothetical protein F5Z01DRAFT_633857 [Emericellopsis atlantica]